MPPVIPHKHDDIGSEKLFARDSLVNAPQETVSTVSGTAGATYTATEQSIINQTSTSLNDLISKLQTIGLIK